MLFEKWKIVNSNLHFRSKNPLSFCEYFEKHCIIHVLCNFTSVSIELLLNREIFAKQDGSKFWTNISGCYLFLSQASGTTFSSNSIDEMVCWQSQQAHASATGEGASQSIAQSTVFGVGHNANMNQIEEIMQQEAQLSSRAQAAVLTNVVGLFNRNIQMDWLFTVMINISYLFPRQLRKFLLQNQISLRHHLTRLLLNYQVMKKCSVKRPFKENQYHKFIRRYTWYFGFSVPSFNRLFFWNLFVD